MRACEQGKQDHIDCPYCGLRTQREEALCCLKLGKAARAVLERWTAKDLEEKAERIAEAMQVDQCGDAEECRHRHSGETIGGGDHAAFSADGEAHHRSNTRNTASEAAARVATMISARRWRAGVMGTNSLAGVQGP